MVVLLQKEFELYVKIIESMNNKIKKELFQTPQKYREDLEQEIHFFILKQLINGRFDDTFDFTKYVEEISEEEKDK